MPKRCQHEGCQTKPTFNNEGEKPKFCKEHMEEGMIDVSHKRCQHEGCQSRPTFNYEGKRPKYCAEHKEEGMIDVVSKRCQHEGCQSRPTFSYEGKRPKYCAEHKEEGMIDVVSKRCQHEGCKIRPVFNYEGKRPKYCAEHMEEGMIDVSHKRCQHEGCQSRPTFNYEGETIRMYCAEHKKSGMVDVVNRKCQHEGCQSRPTYGLLGNIPYHCAVHADKHVEINRPRRRCIKCNDLATHGNEYPVRCETHAIPEDITFETSRCSKCGLQAIINMKSICYYCDEEKHVRLAKQKETVAYLRAQNIPIESVDCIIDSDCGKYRPDIVLNSNSGFFKIIVEVDEGQHKNYQEFCECVRMKNVAEMFFLPILYVRFNPDEYKTPDIDEVPMKKRLIRLKKVLEKYMRMERLECTIGIIQLYFDGWIENRPVEITILES